MQVTNTGEEIGTTLRTITIPFILTDSFWSISISDQGSESEQLPKQ